MRRPTSGGGVRDWLVFGLPGLLLIAAAFYAAITFVEAPPGKTITIAAASKGSPYYVLAERYKAFLAENGVTLEIKETGGSFENLKLLQDKKSGIQAGFLQGGIANSKTAPSLRSLGRIMYEPLWVFVNADVKVDSLADLKGKRVLVGPAGGGTNSLALRMLESNEVTAANATLVNSELPDYVALLESGQADAGFLVLGANARTIQRLFDNPKVRLLSFAQAEAYAQRLPFLSPLDLKQGIVSFARNIPSSDTRLVATRTALAVREDLHPALANLLTQALIAVHAEPVLDAKGEAPVFARAGEFPMQTDPELSMSDQAKRVYRSGPPLLQRYLPFGYATLIDSLIVLAIPLIGVALPLMRFAPMLYTWRVRRRLLYWYRELKKVERGVGPRLDPVLLSQKKDALEGIEEALNRLPIPLGFTNQLYDLRQHIDVVRRRLASIQPVQL